MAGKTLGVVGPGASASGWQICLGLNMDILSRT